MLLLSQIIAKEWFKALAGSLVVLFLLVTVGDIINGFMRNYSASRVMLEYFLKMPELMGKMLPITALLASLFALNKLKTHSELMAILAGGFSAGKVYGLIALCSITVALLQFINLGFLMPQANAIKRAEFEKSRRNESKYLARSQIGRDGLLWYKSQGYFTSFSAYDAKSNELKNVTVYYQSPDGKLDKIIKADSAAYVGPQQWRFDSTQVLSNLDNNIFPTVELQAERFLDLEESPEDFNQFEADITTLNYFALSGFISRLERTGINSDEYKVMLYEKLSLALICIVFALFPASAVFTPNRRASGFGKSVVFTLGFSVVFWLVYSAVVSAGISGKIPPIPATFSIPLIFCVYIMHVFRKNRAL